MNVEIDFRNIEGNGIKRLVWLTDLHLDAIAKMQYQTFGDLLAPYDADIVLIGGDISNGSTTLNHLANLAKIIEKPIYFVLGNHDYYYCSIDEIRKQAEQLSDRQYNLHYLTGKGIIPLSDRTALIGHDGWADGRSGDFINSTVMLNDYFLIEDLRQLNQLERLAKINQLGDESAAYIKKQLLLAFKQYEKVVLLMHVPPFSEAASFKGRPVDDNWAPHFVCQVAGEAIKEVMKQHRDKELLILCGHTHSSQDVYILPNLHVVVGPSELGIPNVQGILYVN